MQKNTDIIQKGVSFIAETNLVISVSNFTAQKTGHMREWVNYANETCYLLVQNHVAACECRQTVRWARVSPRIADSSCRC